MFFCLLKPNLSVTWISGTTSQAIFTSTFTYGAYTNPMVNKMKYGSISSKLYLMGSINNAQYTFFRKVGSDDTSVWTTLTQSQFESHSFDIDYTETYAYSLLGTSSTITIARLLTSDGSIDFAKEFSGASIQIADFYALSWSSSSQTVFYSVADAILFTLYLWRWQDGGTTSDCYQYNSNKPAIAITTIDSNVSYFASVSTPIGNLEFRKVDFSQTNINIWLSSITWSSCTSYTGADGILYDSSSSSVYFLGKTFNSWLLSFYSTFILHLSYKN